MSIRSGRSGVSKGKEIQVSKRLDAMSLRNDSKRIGTISAKNVLNDLVKNGDLNVISLGGDGSALPDGIEDIAAEFADVQKGIITSAISPLTMTLKRDQERKKVPIATMGRVVNLFKKATGNEMPFVKFEKVQVMYIPLFQKTNEEDDPDKKIPSMTVALVDKGQEEAGGDGIIQSITFRADEMALMELSMNFFVKRKDIEKIVVDACVDEIPVEGRAYGAMTIAFFVHEDYVPLRTELKPSTLMYITAMKNPKDMNTKTIFRGMGEKVIKELNSEKEKYKAKSLQRKKELRQRGKKIVIEKEEDEQKSTSSESRADLESVIEAGRKSVSMVNEWLKMNKEKGKEDFETSSVAIGPSVRVNKIRHRNSDHPGLVTMLDTGSDKHFFFARRINPNNSVKNFGGIPFLPVETAEMDFNVNGVNFHLDEVYMFTGRGLGSNILSFSKLKEQGLVDEMVTAGNNLYLQKGEEIIMTFDATESGRMWLKDDAWRNARERFGNNPGTSAEEEVRTGKVDLMN
uniref:58 kDa movement protein n=1 Tax=Blueberry mosaic associated virus TaxID=1520332 RepID=A0A182C2T6_9VIRU|nr:58 kDa movement protein [Blueberry mosaic associated virus]